MTTLYLVRHGETAWNRAGRHQGHRDSPLTLRGISQARAVAALLRGLFEQETGPVRVCCSPLFRTRQTCAILCDELGLDYGAVDFDDRLKERSYGRWEGLTDAEIAAAYPDEWAARAADRWNHRISGGESYPEVARRVGAWLEAQHGRGPVLAVAHGSMGRVLRGVYAGLDRQTMLAQGEAHTTVYRLQDGCITPFDADRP